MRVWLTRHLWVFKSKLFENAKNLQRALVFRDGQFPIERGFENRRVS